VSDRIWIVSEPRPDLEREIARDHGLSRAAARILVSRGLTERAGIAEFLTPSAEPEDYPSALPGMAAAVDRLARAKAGAETVLVFGDYDVDGVTGTALLVSVFRAVGINAVWRIPDRLGEGYGLQASSIEAIRKTGASVVVTVDNGIGAAEAVTAAAGLGIDVIVTDHHEIPRAGPPAGAFAILHPSLPESAGGGWPRGSTLAGVGVAYVLARALIDRLGGGLPHDSLLDLVALGTVADMAPLTGWNRGLVRQGLARIGSGDRLGVRALVKAAGCDRRPITAGVVGFYLGPRINAGGRVGTAGTSVELLLEEDEAEAAALAGVLDGLNRERQAMEEEIVGDAVGMVEKLSELPGAIVLGSEEWHPGVIGIGAARVAERFHRPTLLISLSNGAGKGSARSIPGFDLYAALCECDGLLEKFGGHRYAAGVTVRTERIPELAGRLSEIASREMGEDGFRPRLKIDGPLSADEISMDFAEEIERFAPFGVGNPEPVLVLRNAVVLSTSVLKEKHVKFWVEAGSRRLGGIAWKFAPRAAELARGARVDLAFTCGINEWNGSRSVQLELKDVKAAG
jgi:single-stranded-DNA-specific exonuclease